MQSTLLNLTIKISVALATVLLASCDTFSSVPSGRIRIKNKLSGEEYSTYTVSGGGRSYTLSAGEEALLPSGTYYFSVNYPARDGNRSYQVQCPSDSKLGITVALIDVHSNRIAGGCETVGATHD